MLIQKIKEEIHLSQTKSTRKGPQLLFQEGSKGVDWNLSDGWNISRVFLRVHQGKLRLPWLTSLKWFLPPARSADLWILVHIHRQRPKCHTDKCASHLTKNSSMFLLILLEFTHNFARLRKMMNLMNYHFLMPTKRSLWWEALSIYKWTNHS